MQAERFERLRHLLLEVADLPERERAAYLDEVCKDDPELRREAESILAHDTDESGIVKTGGTVPQPPAELLVGQTVSHYRILEQLGVGGMGVVFKAEDTTLKRTVALKFLPPELTRDPAAKARFLREAQAAAALDHANICTVHEIGESEGQTFIAMAYVEGRSLKEMMAAGPLELDQAVILSIQLAEGLKAAHDKGIVHRDIKPGNILVTSAGRAEIADFGLAKFSGRSEITTGGTRMGTVSYMSPEQARGDAVDHRTDIWSLGAMLYEMVTGQRPFRGDHDTAVVYAILNEEPEPIASVREGVTQELQWVVDKAMAKSPDERYQTAGEMLGDLRSLRRGLDQEAGRAQLIAAKRRPSIAVLPFVNMSGDPEDEYFSDGLAEDLINALSHVRDLRVVARTSAFSFKGKDVDTREIGRKLRVGTLLEGSVRRSGDRLRVTAQLVNAADGYHLWSERYDRQMRDVFAIQDDISLAITDKLKVKLIGEEQARLSKRRAVDQEAHHLYLKGQHFVGRGRYGKALPYFEQAIAKDPSHALSYVAFARASSGMVSFGNLAPKKAIPKAKDYARRALEIDETFGEAYSFLGLQSYLYDYDWVEAERQLRRGIELNPNYELAHSWYALYLSIMRRSSEAIRETELALDLDPVSLFANSMAGGTLTWAKQYDKALEQFRKMLDMDPNYPHGRISLGELHLTTGRYEDAIAEFQGVLAFAGEITWALGELGWAYGLSGRKDEALKVLDRLNKLSQDRYVPYMHKAFVYFGLGEADQALALCEKGYWARDQILIGARHPLMDPYRSHPKFVDVCKKMGLEP